MNKLWGILLATLALNATLAVAVFRQPHPTAVANRPAVPAAPVPPAATPDKSAATTAKTFQWSLLQADDLKKYIVNLRAFGIPEKVVRDIILAEVARGYRPKFAAVRGQKHVPDEKFWEHPPGRPEPLFDQTKEQRDQERTLRREQNELVKSLLGEDVFRQIARDSGLPDTAAAKPEVIPPALSDKVAEIRSRYQDAETDLVRDNNGSYDEFAEDDRQKLENQLHNELAAILTPAQLEKYELRTSQTADQLRTDLKWFEPNEQEFRAFFDYRQAFDAAKPVPVPGEPPSQQAVQAFLEKKKTLDQTLVQAIGTNRLQEYYVTTAGAFRSLLEAGVSRETVIKIANIRRQAETSARQINGNQSLSPEQRSAALKEVQTGAQKAVGELLTEKQLKTYQYQGGRWLQALAPND